MKQVYGAHQIETTSEREDGFIHASAKIRPPAGYISTMTLMGGFPSAEEAERAVLEKAKTLIDNARGI